MDPKDLLNNPEQIKSLIGLLQTLLSQTNESETPETINQESNPNKTTKRNSNIKTKTRQRNKTINTDSINEFEKMAEFRMHKEDAKIDQALSKHPPVARMRDFDPIDVTCRICGKKESVSPGLVFEGASRYKCNNCSTQAG